MGLPAKSPQAILWGPRKEGEQYSHVSGLHPIPRLSTTPASNKCHMTEKEKPLQGSGFLSDHIRYDYLLSFSRISTRRILPEMVLGISVTNSMMRGYL